MDDANVNIELDIDIEAVASAAAAGAVVVDVREPSEYATGHVPGARLLPSTEIRSRLYELPRASTVYMICANGARSRDLVPFMRAVGYNAYSVAGGMWAWLASDRPTEDPTLEDKDKDNR